MTHRVDLPANWLPLAAQVRGNARHPRRERVTGAPALAVHLDRTCYPPGAQATVTVNGPAETHLYLIAHGADGSLYRLYPNRLLPDRPHPDGALVFPPPPLRQRLAMSMHTAGRGPIREHLQAIVSPRPMGLDFVPVPENAFPVADWPQVRQRLEALLRASPGVRVRDLPYWVGAGCEGMGER